MESNKFISFQMLLRILSFLDTFIMAAQHNHYSRSPVPTQLEFNQAMTDFKTMFPTMDAEVIEAVLRSNGGAVEATIDNLLAMSADAEEVKINIF